jgi:hypothetical protein
MVVHGTVLFRGAVEQIVMPPVLLENTTSSCLVAALTARLPASINQLRAQFDTLSVIVNSDSARACKLLGRAIGDLYKHDDKVRTLNTYCMMHLVVIAVNEMLKPMRIINPLYCLTKVMQDGNLLEAVKKELESYVSIHLEQCAEPRDPLHAKYSHQVLLQ